MGIKASKWLREEIQYLIPKEYFWHLWLVMSLTHYPCITYSLDLPSFVFPSLSISMCVCVSPHLSLYVCVCVPPSLPLSHKLSPPSLYLPHYPSLHHPLSITHLHPSLSIAHPPCSVCTCVPPHSLCIYLSVCVCVPPSLPLS